LCLSGGCIRSAALRTGYTCFQLLGDAMEGAKTLDDSKLAGTTTPFTTIRADDIRFGENGEWVVLRALRVQYYHYQ
jgi:hypothetical protein